MSPNRISWSHGFRRRPRVARPCWTRCGILRPEFRVRVFREAAERLTILQTVHPERWDLHALPTARIQALARFAATARAQTVERLTPERRVATLVAFAVVF